MRYAGLFKAIFFTVILMFAKVLCAQQPIPLELSVPNKIYASPIKNICSNDIILDRLRKDPAFGAAEEKMNRDILNATRHLTSDTITLPVVVHIINSNPASITDLNVINGIKDLNDAFSKSGVYSASPGADTKIRFCLAQKDPDGGNTSGITRTKSFFSDHLNMDIEDARLKNLIQWDPQRYINIWLITSINAESYADFICGNWYRLGVGGYATLPPGGGALDGIVITAFGTVLAHEMGHYLGLYHTFQGGCTNNNCMVDGDAVCDTPPDNSVRPSPSCASPQNSCTTDTLSAHSMGFFPTDVPDQISNFMDYGNGGCSIQFTQGQADRMRAAINTQRSGLLQDECNSPCAESILAGFTRDIAYPVPGDLISFTNTSSGAANYKWLVDGVEIANTTDFSYTFPAVGKYKVTLKSYNNDTACFASYSDDIILNCGVTARFYTNKKAIASKLNVYEDSIRFTNTSYNGQTYNWLITNNLGLNISITDSVNLTYVFPTPATYQITLIASNGSCSDTTEAYTVQDLDPTADGAPYNISVMCFQPNKVRVNFCLADYGFAPLPINTPVNFYDADPRLPGANRLSPTFYLTSAVPGGNCALCFTHVLNVAYANLEKIYLVFNDAGTSNPVILPNAVLEEKSYNNNFGNSIANRTTIIAAICQGQSYAGYTTAGTYVDSYVSVNNGCDSIRTLILTIKPVFATDVTASICQGKNYAGHTTAGTYVDVYTAVNGCDSTRTLHLSILPVFSTNIAATICQGQNYYGHTTTGTYVDVYAAINGCDSTRTLQLLVNPTKVTNLSATICAGQTYISGGYPKTVTGIYYDTLRTYLNCDSLVITNLTVNPLPVPDLGIDRGVCIDSVLTLDPGIFSSYLWQDGSVNQTFVTNVIGQYSVTVKNAFGCKASDTMKLTRIYPLPARFLPADSSLCRGNILEIKVPGYAQYNWSTGSNENFIDITKTDTYSLQVIDVHGCKGNDTMKVFFYTDCITIQVPNAFTPNDDSKNDVFKPLIPAPVQNYSFQIWSRWGQLLFETKDYKKGWDGTFHSQKQSPGVFVYLISFKDQDGNNVKKKGSFVLIR